jgi:hypothetical protein
MNIQVLLHNAGRWLLICYITKQRERSNIQYNAAEILVPLDKGQCKAMVYYSGIHCKSLQTIQSPMKIQYMFCMLGYRIEIQNILNIFDDMIFT